MQLKTPMFGNEPNSGGELVILKANNECVIAGYASVDVVDKQNDKITLGAIREAADKFMKQDRYRNVMITHSNVQVGEVVDQYTDSNGKVLKTGVDDTGFFVVIKLRNDIEKAKEVARDIRKGNLRSFSIGGQAINKTNKYDSDTGSYKEIDKLELHEITICEEGINPEAKFNLIKEDKKMNTEIEKALNEFNEVMAELRESTVLKNTMDTLEQEEELEMMDEGEESVAVGDEEMKAEEDDVEEEDYEGEEMKAEFSEFVEAKGESIDTLDLSNANIEKAYEQFKAEREEARAYEVIKAEFEARYNNELKVEADAIAKSKFNAADAVLSLKEEFSQLKESLENNTIAKAAEVQNASATLSEDFSSISEMSWNEVHELMDKYNRGA
jgi:HK97 family phage prohead protease